MTVFEKELKHAKKQLSPPGELHEYTGFFGGIKNFDRALFKSVINELFDVVIRTKEVFDSHARYVLCSIFSHGQEKIKTIAPVLKAFHETMTNLQELKKKASRNGE